MQNQGVACLFTIGLHLEFEQVQSCHVEMKGHHPPEESFWGSRDPIVVFMATVEQVCRCLYIGVTFVLCHCESRDKRATKMSRLSMLSRLHDFLCRYCFIALTALHTMHRNAALAQKCGYERMSSSSTIFIIGCRS